MLRNIYYLLNAFYINITNKNIKVSYSSKIKRINKIKGPCRIGKNTFFDGEIGKYSYIGKNCEISAKIGNFCSIASNVKVVSGNHPLERFSTSPVFFSKDGQCIKSFVNKKTFDDFRYVDNEKKLACEIGNDVWIGENVLIRGGVKIGNGSCIAMGSVVVDDVEPFSIVGGVPAKKIRERFPIDIIIELEKLEWWNRSDRWLNSMSGYYMDIKKFIKEANKK